MKLLRSEVVTLVSSREPVLTAAEKLETTPGGRKGTFDTLRLRNFRIFWFGTLTNFFGMMMQAPAQAWLAYEITRSPLMLGLVSAAWAIPICLFSMFSGVIIDRVRKRNLLRLSQLGMLALMLVVGILIAAGVIRFWHLLVAAFLNGTFSAFSFPTSQALIPELVPRNRLFNAIALNSAAFNVARVAAPALSGVLIGVGGASAAYFCSVGFFILAATMTSLLPASTSSIEHVKRSLKNELKEGIQYLRANDIILILIGMEVVIAMLGMPSQNLMPVFAEIFQVSAFGYGMLMAVMGLGALLGSLGMAAFGHRIRSRGKFLLVTGFAYGILLVVFATSVFWGRALNLGSAAVFAASFVLVLVGVFNTFYLSTSATTIQMQVEDRVRGRVMGVYGTVMGLMPLGVLPAGAVAESIGAPCTVTILGGVLAVFILAVAVFAGRVRDLE